MGNIDTESRRKAKLRQKSCTVKERFDHKKDAHRIVLKMNELYPRKFYLYHCEFCQGFHIAHKKNHSTTSAS